MKVRDDLCLVHEAYQYFRHKYKAKDLKYNIQLASANKTPVRKEKEADIRKRIKKGEFAHQGELMLAKDPRITKFGRTTGKWMEKGTITTTTTTLPLNHSQCIVCSHFSKENVQCWEITQNGIPKIIQLLKDFLAILIHTVISRKLEIQYSV